MGITIYAFLAGRIREERKRRGLTLEQLAAAADISTGFLAYIEQNRKKSSLATVERLAAALELPLADLFRGAPARRPYDTKLLAQIASVIKEAPPKKRSMMVRVLKDIARAD